MDKETSPSRQTETLDQQLQRILATLELSKAQPITAKPIGEKEKEKMRRRWSDSFLKIKTNHPQLVELERIVYDFKCEYQKSPEHGKGKRLIIFGGNGAGKSHTAKAIARWHWNTAFNLPRVLDTGDTPYSADNVVTYRQPKHEFRNWLRFLKTVKGGEWDGVKTLCHAELVIVDDVGAEHDPGKFGASELYELLERRERDWTIITTNIAPDEWESKFERRISSRFWRNMIHAPLDRVPDFNTV